jgi:hypothetical protein
VPRGRSADSDRFGQFLTDFLWKAHYGLNSLQILSHSHRQLFHKQFVGIEGFPVKNGAVKLKDLSVRFNGFNYSKDRLFEITR